MSWLQMSSSDKLRLCLLIPRKKGLTEEEFHKYWADVHGPSGDGMVSVLRSGPQEEL